MPMIREAAEPPRIPERPTEVHQAHEQSERKSRAGIRSRRASGALIALLRPRQWIKNGFVAAPLFFTPSAMSTQAVVDIGLAVLAFCLLASSTYVLNDYIDRESDRLHPIKKHRPLASGAISVQFAAAAGVVLLVAAGSLSLFISVAFALMAATYLGVSVVYSLYFKTIAILDVLLVALGFVLRLEAGARVIEAVPSAWILIATGLLALFIALTKRRDDLVQRLGTDHRKSLDGYNVVFLDVSATIMLACFLVSYLLYTTDSAVMERLGTENLFYTTPFVVAGVLRYLQLTIVYQRSGSPTEIVFKDTFIRIAVVLWLLTFGALIYT